MEVIYWIDSLSSRANPLVAGGAPRDWDVGLPATDVDLWITATGATHSIIRKLTRNYRTRMLVDNSALEGLYIKCVLDVHLHGETVQLIVVDDSSPREVISRFCCTLSEAIWKHETDELIFSPDYLMSRQIKEYIIYDGPDENRKPSEAYLKKMRSKFPDYVEKIDF